MAGDEDPPPPLIYARHKHHLPAIVARLAALRAGAESLDDVLARSPRSARACATVYVGALSVAALADIVRAWLDDHAIADRARFAAHLQAHGALQRRGHYLELTLADDSRWVLRAGGDDARYVHVHPARHGPRTIRARTNVLRTALVAHALAAADGAPAASAGDPTHLDAARERLGLPPLRAPDDALARLLDLIADTPASAGDPRETA